MSNPRIIQRSPDLGIGIRLQRLPQAAPLASPQPPWWWGWMDASGQRATTLDVLWDIPADSGTTPEYWPGLWVAVVEGATAVRWEVEFTPKLWVKSDLAGAKAAVVWQGTPIALQFAPALPATPGALFTPAQATFPNPVDLPLGGSNAYEQQYWSDFYTIPGFPDVLVPKVVAAGNTLSVAQDKWMGGSMDLIAKAFANDVSVGTVTLTFKRVMSPSLT